MLLASLPSSGSDWLAGCIARSHPALRYRREYFSPIANWRRSQRLATVLGDTLFYTTPQLCRARSRAEIQSLLDSTWRQDGFNFTKENYLAFQIEQFAETFTVIVLLRRFEDTFPPHRHRVMRWYEHFHGALAVNGAVDEWTVARSATPMNRAAIGYYWFARRLRDAASALCLPIFWFHDLSSLGACDLARRLWPAAIDRDALCREILATRSPVERPTGEYRQQWAVARRLYRDIEWRYGPLLV